MLLKYMTEDAAPANGAHGDYEGKPLIFGMLSSSVCY